MYTCTSKDEPTARSCSSYVVEVLLELVDDSLDSIYLTTHKCSGQLNVWPTQRLCRGHNTHRERGTEHKGGGGGGGGTEHTTQRGGQSNGKRYWDILRGLLK